MLAEGESGGPGNAQTYILIANTSGATGLASIEIVGETVPDGAFFNITLPPHSRTTVPMRTYPFPYRFGALIRSLGADPVPIVVEGAFYWTVDGVLWAAGSNVVATPIP